MELLDTDSAIRLRKTTKVLAQVNLPTSNSRALVEELLNAAAMAPFHRACDESHRRPKALDGIEPWRFHMLDAADCRRLRQRIPQEKAGKIPAMLSAADVLLLATWLPNPAGELPASSQKLEFEPSLGNMEHIAAASAAIQNLLLAATARGVSSYWSSGGDILRSPEIFSLLQIPSSEILLGAIFLFPKDIGDAVAVGSKLRDKRCAADKWSRWAVVDSAADGE